MVVLHPPTPSKISKFSVPHPTAERLQAIPWAAQILADEAYTPLDSYSRNPQPHHGVRYTFLSKTLKSDTTVRLWQPFHRSPSPASADPYTTGEDDFGELLIITELGNGGLEGHLNTLHGGVVSTILDEATGMIAGIHKRREWSIYTGYMKVNFKRPVMTPGVYLVRARLDGGKREGRKIFTLATVEDGTGGVLAVAEALFVEVERKAKI